jgi:hypothetical protein
MTAELGGRGEFTEAQRAGLSVRSADQDRTLAAMHQLEAGLEAAASGRPGPWWQDVTTALAVLDAATTDEESNAGRPDSLLSDIKRTQPRLRTRVRGVRAQYAQLRRALGELRDELNDAQDAPADVADIRQRLAWLLTALRHQRARESDLIYEAYFDAFNADLRREAANPG